MKTLTYHEYLENSYYPALDGLRALSILMVITVHMRDDLWAWLHGEQGVTIFFVISGYLITTLCLKEETRDGFVNINAFFVRRIFRIFPLYYFMVAVYSFLILIVGLGSETLKSDFLTALPYYMVYLNEYVEPSPFGQSWSLGVEEKFYLIWPILSFVILQNNKLGRILCVSLVIFGIQLMPILREDKIYAGYSSIMIGCLIAILMYNKVFYNKISKMLSQITIIGALIIITISQLTYSYSAVNRINYPLIVGFFMVHLLVTDSFICNILSSKVMVYIGKRSYGIYLVHLLSFEIINRIVNKIGQASAIRLLAYLFTVLVSVLVAEVLHKLIEKPMMDIGKRIVRQKARFEINITT